MAVNEYCTLTLEKIGSKLLRYYLTTMVPDVFLTCIIVGIVAVVEFLESVDF